LPEIKGLEYVILVLSIGLIGLASSQTGRDGVKTMYNNLLKNIWND
jgi:hypothetical protein